MNRRELIIRLVRGASLAVVPCAHGADPWKQEDLIKAADLAKRIETGNGPRVICVAFPALYRQRHIRDAQYAGPGNKTEGIDALVKLASTLPPDSEVILYCGCCPMKDCPNIRPAYEALKRSGFKALRVLDIPNNFHNDWTTKGYPCEPPQAPRIKDA